MGRPLRVEFSGAIYHVTSRGNRRERIFVDDDDRLRLLDIVADAMGRFEADAFAFCLMGNHYHLVVRTHRANLSHVMQHLNGNYARAFNKRHSLSGHLFQRRFHAMLVDRDAYLMELCRYVELNPVRARLVSVVGDWRWSSYNANVGLAVAPTWLATRELHEYVLRRPVRAWADHAVAARAYTQLVADGIDVASESWRKRCP